jgi:hypothetical protein
LAAARPAVAETLERWHAMLASGDLAPLPALIHPEATFRSPMAFKPYAGAQAVEFVLRTVYGVFRDFRYHRQLFSEDGLNVVLEFSAEAGGKSLKGIDLIRFDDQGLIRDFEVMVRPFNGLQALGEEMGKRVAAVLPAWKAKG